MHVAHVRYVDNRFLVSGQLNFSNVMLLLAESKKHIKNVDVLIFDFSQVTASDSAGLALIIEWVKLAKMYRKQIKLQHISGELMSLARASSLDKLII